MKPKAQWAGQVFIEAATESTCDVPPAQHKVQVWLEENVLGEWVRAAAPGGEPYALCEEIPPPGAWVRCSYLYYQCRPGFWRTRVLITGSGPQGEAFAFEPPEKPVTEVISCPKG